MPEERCKKCGVVLDKKENKCPCREATCRNCCECPPDCSCGCKDD